MIFSAQETKKPAKAGFFAQQPDITWLRTDQLEQLQIGQLELRTDQQELQIGPLAQQRLEQKLQQLEPEPRSCCMQL